MLNPPHETAEHKTWSTGGGRLQITVHIWNKWRCQCGGIIRFDWEFLKLSFIISVFLKKFFFCLYESVTPVWMASVCYFCPSPTTPVFLFLPLITFTVLQAHADCDAQRWKTLHNQYKVMCEVKSRKSIVSIKSEVLLSSGSVIHMQASSLVCRLTTRERNHTVLLLSRRFIKTHWTNTQNTNKKMTIHFFIQLLYSTNIRTITLLGAHCL